MVRLLPHVLKHGSQPWRHCTCTHNLCLRGTDMNAMPVRHYFSNTCRHSVVSRQDQHTVNMDIIGMTALSHVKLNISFSSRGYILVVATSNNQKRAAIHITVLLQLKKKNGLMRTKAAAHMTVLGSVLCPDSSVLPSQVAEGNSNWHSMTSEITGTV